ncbi:MAG: hypothetical protein P8164_01685 [Gammaproteobacteria bacterium]|jgi:hypothetical protein
MDNTASLLWGLIFGSIGFAYFIYGKKQKRGVPFASGIGLMVYPYFVSNTYAMVIVGVVLLALPYYLRY